MNILYDSVTYLIQKVKIRNNKFALLIRMVLKKCLKLRRSTPNNVVTQIIGDPKVEWHPHSHRYLLGSIENANFFEYISDKTIL